MWILHHSFIHDTATTVCSVTLLYLILICFYLSRVTIKPAFSIYAKTKGADQLVTAQLIRAFVFTTLIVHSLYRLNQKFQATSHHLWRCSPVCVGPGRKPQRQVFSRRSSFVILYLERNELKIALPQNRRILKH